MSTVDKSVPRDWKIARLGDLVSMNQSQWNPTEGSNIRYLDITAVIAPGKLAEPTELSANNAPSRARRRVREGDILVSTVRPNLRGFARVREAAPTLVASTGFTVLTPAPEVDGSLVYQHVMTHAFAQHLDKRTTGQAYPAVRPDDVASYKLLLPPPHEQRAIAAVLDSIDEAIERTEEVIAATERLRDALLHDLLTRGLPGRHTEWKEVRGLGTIPASWNVVRLGDVCEPPEYGAVASAQPYDPDLPRYVRITDLTDDGRLRNEELRSADPVAVGGYELLPGDMLFARSGATVGKTYMYRSEDGPCVYAGYLIRFRPQAASLYPGFLELWTHTQMYHRWVQSMLRAAAQPNINATEYASLRIPLPTMTEQKRISEVFTLTNAAIQLSRMTSHFQRCVKESASESLLSGRYAQRQSNGSLK